MEEEKSILKIVVHYDDGTTRLVTKGFVADVHIEEEVLSMPMEFVNMSGEDLISAAYGMASFSSRILGPSEEDDE